ncbi:MAG: UDP-N-acetylmuramoyl-L-alanine--D-glutamate ligase [Actinomycetota bacterium]
MTAGQGPDLDLGHPLVVGFGVTGRAVARALVSRGHRPTVIEDRAGDAHREAASGLGVRLVEGPDDADLAGLAAEATVLLPSPGVPDHHPIFAAAAEAGLPTASEFDLAQRWDDRTVVALTGTNGKTTVTMMVADALNRSGVPAEAVGNTDVPFVEAIDRPETRVFVVEASSFRLGHSHRFRPDVAAWLNFAPDHLDAHATLDDYEAAKASIWADLPAGATVVANAEDPVVAEHVPAAGPELTVRRFALADPTTGTPSSSASPADWRVDVVDGVRTLVGPDGPLVAVERLRRSQPHDVANALATAAIATAGGATTAGIVDTLTSFEGLPHRLEYLGSWGDVAWYNDSKATVPHATVAAVGGFDSVVLIAGGYDKGLPFEPLRATVPPVRTVVAIGDAAPKIDSVFGDLVPVTRAESMRAAIATARSVAEAGDAVLLSPACASFDWYPNYVQRGLDFSALVREEVGTR